MFRLFKCYIEGKGIHDWTYNPDKEILSTTYGTFQLNITLKTNNSWAGVSLAQDKKAYTAEKKWYDVSHLIYNTHFCDREKPQKKLIFGHFENKYTHYDCFEGSALEADSSYLSKGTKRECNFVNSHWNYDKPYFYDTEGNEYEGIQWDTSFVPEIDYVKFQSHVQSLNHVKYMSTVELHNPYSYSQSYLKVNIKRYYGDRIGDGGKELVIQRIDSITGIFVSSKH